MDTFLQKMGERILKRRKELKLTQEQVAERAELTPQTISSAERGEKALRPENIVKICSALEVTPNYLLLGSTIMESQNHLPDRISELTPRQTQHLMNIIEEYIAALSLTE